MTEDDPGIVAAMPGSVPSGSTPPAPAAPEQEARRQDAQRTVARIVEAATHVLADVPDATMQEIADAAGLGRATVYRHFANRDELMVAIKRAAFDEIRQALADRGLERGGVVEGLHRALEAIFEVGDRYRVLVERPHEKPAAAVERAAVMEAFRPVSALIERARQEGVLRADVPHEWIGAVIGSLIGTAFAQVAQGELTRAEAPSLVVRTLLDGVAARPPQGSGPGT